MKLAMSNSDKHHNFNHPSTSTVFTIVLPEFTDIAPARPEFQRESSGSASFQPTRIYFRTANFKTIPLFDVESSSLAVFDH